MNKPTKRQVLQAFKELNEAGCTPNFAYEELSEHARKVWKKNYPIIFAYIGYPTEEMLDNVLERGVAFPA